MDVEEELKVILSDTYGGPSVSFEDGMFIIYQWYDAPVSEDILAKGETLVELIENYKEKKKKKKKKKKS